MKTASHFTYYGPGRIVISLGNPRGVPGGYKMFKPLAPGRDMLSLPYDAYRERFFRDILGKLDPQATWDELHRLAGGAEPVLQCFEKPPFNERNWCHRRMVAEWFEQALDVTVDELDPKVGLAAAPKPAPAPRRKTTPAIDNARMAIERFKLRLYALFGIRRSDPGPWLSVPVAVAERMSPTQRDEWFRLQAVYRDAEGL